MSTGQNDFTFEDFVKRYYIVSGKYYFPKISVLKPGQTKPPKYTIEDVKQEYERRKQTPD